MQRRKTKRFYGDPNAELMSKLEELLGKSAPAPTPTPTPQPDAISKSDHEAALKAVQDDFAKREKEMASQMEALKNQFNGTTEEKSKLEAMLKEIETRNMTAEEKARAEVEKERKVNAKAIEDLTAKASTWEKRFIARERDQRISSAATVAEAFNPQQIIDLLSGKSKVEEDVDDKGSPTGNYSVKISVQTEEGLVDMPVDQAINHMKESKEHRNLFKSKEKGGFGFREPTTKGSAVDNISKASVDDLAAEMRKGKK